MGAKLRILENGAVFDIPDGEDLLEVLQKNGYPIATSCGGMAVCGLCRITIVSGKEALTPFRTEELTHLGNVAKVIGTRLACQSRATCDGEIVVSVPEVEDVEERKRRKSLRMRTERAERAQKRGPSQEGAPPASSPRERTSSSNETIEWRPRLTPKRED